MPSLRQITAQTARSSSSAGLTFGFIGHYSVSF